MIGKTISHYKILSKLGEGGMGVVYKAEDTKLKREVAIKFLPRQISASDEERERFKIEAQAAAALNHPNIATIHNIEETDDEIFIVMEYIKGHELKDKIDAGPLSIDDTLNIAIQIAQGLQSAHSKDVVHRDIKSANIMLTDEGVVKIMDFGLAKRGGQSKLTQQGTTLGTVAYMSPEQAKGDEVDHRSDIYSLGVIMYEMLTGQLPFQGDYDQAVIYSILNEHPEPATGLRTGVPMELERITNKCLEKDISDRYPSAADLIVDLRKLKKESETKEIRTKTGDSPKLPGESKRPTYILPAILGLAVLVLIVGYLLSGKDSGGTVIRLINPRQLTSGIGVETHPTWSPDNGRLAYSATGDIWVMQLGGGQPVNRTQAYAGLDGFPSWSPNGNQIAFLSDRDGGGYFTMPAVGGSPRLIAGKKASSAPVWSADSRELTYVVSDTSGIFVETISLDDRESRRWLLPGKSVGRIDLSRTAKGEAIAYVDGIDDNEVTQLWISRSVDGKGFPVTDGLFNDRSPTWSGDGRILYFVSNRGGSMDLWQLRLGPDFRPEGSSEPLTTGIGMRDAVFSSDGRKLAYTKGRRVANIWRIRIPEQGHNPATWTNAEQITFDNAYIEFLDISKDGQDLVFSSDRMGNQDIWRMPVNSGELQQLTTHPTPDWDPAFSPDGRQIVFYAYRSGNRDIWTIPASGGAARQLTTYEGDDSLPNWTPDGKNITYFSTRDGFGLWLIPTLGGEPTRLTSSFEYSNTCRWSPDGRRIAVRGVHRGSDGWWLQSVTNRDIEPIQNSGNVRMVFWAPDGKRLYMVIGNEQMGFESQVGVDFWELNLESGLKRRLSNFAGRYGQLLSGVFAPDGPYIYFNWREDTGDLWVMDAEMPEQ